MTPAERRSYVNRVRGKLKRRPRELELQHIADATGLSLGWLKSFARAAYANPDVNLVCTLGVFLDNYKPSDVE